MPPESAFRHLVSQSSIGAFRYRAGLPYSGNGLFPASVFLFIPVTDWPDAGQSGILAFAKHVTKVKRNTNTLHSDGLGYTPHVHTASGVKGYTLQVHTAGCGKGYTLHVHTAGDGKDTPCTSILLTVDRDTPCTSKWWKGYTLHGHTAGDGKRDTLHFHFVLLALERDTPCTSILLALDRDTHCTSILLALERDTPCTSILLAVESGTPCTSILLAVDRGTPCTSIYGCWWCYSCYVMLKIHSKCRNARKNSIRHRHFYRYVTASVRHRHSGIRVSPVPLVTDY